MRNFLRIERRTKGAIFSPSLQAAQFALTRLTSVIAEPPNFYFLAWATERSITAARELLRKPQPSRKKAIPARALRAVTVVKSP